MEGFVPALALLPCSGSVLAAGWVRRSRSDPRPPPHFTAFPSSEHPPWKEIPEGNLGLCPGFHPLWIWAQFGDFTHPSSSWAGVNSPPGAPSHREFPEPQACCDPSPRDFIHWGDCNPKIQGRKEREHHPRMTQGRTTTPSPPSRHLRVHISPQPSHHPQGAK